MWRAREEAVALLSRGIDMPKFEFYEINKFPFKCQTSLLFISLYYVQQIYK